MSSLVDATEKAIGSPEAAKQAQEYVKTVEAWEKAGLLPKQLSPVRDDKIVIPNVARQPVSFSTKSTSFPLL